MELVLTFQHKSLLLTSLLAYSAFCRDDFSLYLIDLCLWKARNSVFLWCINCYDVSYLIAPTRIYSSDCLSSSLPNRVKQILIGVYVKRFKGIKSLFFFMLNRIWSKLFWVVNSSNFFNCLGVALGARIGTIAVCGTTVTPEHAVFC